MPRAGRLPRTSTDRSAADPVEGRARASAPAWMHSGPLDAEAESRALEHARNVGVDLSVSGASELVTLVGAAAPAVLPSLLFDPTLCARLAHELLARGVIAPSSPDAFAHTPSPSAPPEDPTATKRRLRSARHEALARTALRELFAFVDVDSTAREWSRFAAASIAHALAAAHALVDLRFGPPLDDDGARIATCVLGMGKLGGGELNLGSDVDLCFFYATDEGRVGTGDRTVHEYFSRVAAVVTELLEDRTEDGFAFRVDLRLRPEGSRGPLANSLASAERYYETWGRSWERAALLRARPVAGDPTFGQTLYDALRPFVFRRSVDPKIARDVADMLFRARRELLTDDARDLKLGRGGIREAEFFVQALQLVWGGRHPSLQVAHTLEAAQQLRALGLLSHSEARTFSDAWSLLRRVEHRVQSMAPYATHLVPETEVRRAVLARSLGYGSTEAFDRALGIARDAIARLFDTITPPDAARSPERANERSPETALADLVAAGADRVRVAAVARDVLSVRDGESAAEDLARLARRADLPLGTVGRERTPALGPRLLAEVRDAPDPDRALSYLADLFNRLRTPEPYARRLESAPDRTRGLVGLFGASDTLSRTLLARPDLLDAVVAGGSGAPTATQIEQRLCEALDPHALDPQRDREVDLDRAVGALRRCTREITLEIGLADMASALRIDDVLVRLSALAEGSVRACFALAAAETQRRFGAPESSHDGDALLAGICVVAMGSLAARELGYGGDVDLVVIHGLEAPTRGAARAPVSSHEYVARVAQRALTFLSAPHEEGDGYAADTRLRPSGAQGTLVSSLEGFAQYHAPTSGRPAAAAWERQALIRARACAGDPALSRRVDSMLAQIAYDPGATDPAAVRQVRARMELELGRERPGVLSLKYGPGGLVDVEFTAQVLQLAHGANPAVRTPVTHDALRALRAVGALDDDDAETLLESETLLRRALLATRLVTGRSTLLVGHPSTSTVARTLGFRTHGEHSAEERFVETLARHRAAVRRVFDRLVPLR